MYYIGVDLGGTKIAAGLVSEKGEILLSKNTPTLREREYTEIVKDMADLCIDLIKDYNLDISQIHSIGIGSPGSPDPVNGILLYSNNLKFKDTPIRDEMRKYIDLPIYLENDANCAALGENFAGAAKSAKNSVMITLGTGLGGGIIIDHKIYSGSYYGGAELGHMVIQVGGEPCTCGRHGCWETYSSATAIIRESRLAAEKNHNGEIYKLVNGNLDLIDAKTPFDAAEKGDADAKNIIGTYLNYLAEGIANVVNVFQPEIIVIGGGVCAQGDNILIPLKNKVDNLIYGGEVKTKLVIASLGNDAGIIGAAVLGIQ